VDRPPLDVASADSLLQSSAPAVVDPRVRTVLQYVESRHVNSACRLDDVARNLRVSRSYLSRLVFKETGVTFNRHLQLARMNTAARLLQESELSIKEISSGTGYEHVPSFDRQFRSHFNLTPGDFRRAVRLS
jgi:AraC-like DNA-binding protein